MVPVRRGRRDQTLLFEGKLRSNLVETLSEQGCRILKGVVRTAEQAQLQPLEELEAALDSICKAWQNRTSGRFSCQGVRRSWRAPSASSQVRLWTCGLDGTWPRRPVDRSAGRRYMHNVLSWRLDRLRVEGIHPGSKTNDKRVSKESNT